MRLTTLVEKACARHRRSWWRPNGIEESVLDPEGRVLDALEESVLNPEGRVIGALDESVLDPEGRVLCCK